MLYYIVVLTSCKNANKTDENSSVDSIPKDSSLQKRDIKFSDTTKIVNIDTSFSNNNNNQEEDLNENDTLIGISIGQQIWATKNLNVSHFKNGDTIFHAITIDDWHQASEKEIPAWCYYNNNSTNGKIYGKLYNWYAVNDTRGLAPDGWQIPANYDFDFLKEYIHAVTNEWSAGYHLRSKTGWEENSGGSDKYGFNALPGGRRNIDNDDNKDFSLMGDQAIFWTTTEFHNPSVVVNVKDDGLEAYSIVFDLFSNFGTYYGDLNKGFGFSVRCFKK